MLQSSIIDRREGVVCFSLMSRSLCCKSVLVLGISQRRVFGADRQLSTSLTCDEPRSSWASRRFTTPRERRLGSERVAAAARVCVAPRRDTIAR
eukprot:7181557-Prymnesium_polylepis.1